MKKGFHLFKEGDIGNFYYIIKSGELEIIYPTGETKKLQSGDSFGELALIQKNIRTSDVQAITDIEIYCLEGEIFKEIILKMNNNNLKERIKLLNKHPIFKYFAPNQIHEIAVNMLKCEFEKNEIIEQGQIKDSLFLITEGSFGNIPNISRTNISGINKIRNNNNDKISKSLIEINPNTSNYFKQKSLKSNRDKFSSNEKNPIENSSEISLLENTVTNNNTQTDKTINFSSSSNPNSFFYFGLSGLIYSNKRYNNNIISQSYSKCFRITNAVFESILGKNYSQKILENLAKNAFSKIKMLKLLSNEQYLSRIFEILKLRIYNKNDVVFDLLNEKSESKFVILLEGDLIDVKFFLIFLIL